LEEETHAAFFPSFQQPFFQIVGPHTQGLVGWLVGFGLVWFRAGIFTSKTRIVCSWLKGGGGASLFYMLLDDLTLSVMHTFSKIINSIAKSVIIIKKVPKVANPTTLQRGNRKKHIESL
jgi:hypothetical protein